MTDAGFVSAKRKEKEFLQAENEAYDGQLAEIYWIKRAAHPQIEIRSRKKGAVALSVFCG